jgi:hypothetical protein
LDITPYLPEIDSKTHVKVGGVNETDLSRVYGKGIKSGRKTISMRDDLSYNG